MENILITEKSEGYELLDSGDGEKLERFGNVILSRPDPQAIWQKSLPEEKWQEADAIFTRGGTTGKWQTKDLSEPWQVTLEDLTFSLKLLPSKHVGVFPEQSQNWKWLGDKLKVKGEKLKVLNLFGYTGGATLACAKAGAEVVHVDASEFAVGLAKENAKLSGLADAPIRFIVDDVRKFVEREIKRGSKYDVIILDPPVYGKGSNKQVWKLEEDLIPLLSRLPKILSDHPIAMLLNGYAAGYSQVTYSQVLETATKTLGGSISSLELAIRESSGGRLLPSGIFARWEK